MCICWIKGSDLQIRIGFSLVQLILVKRGIRAIFTIPAVLCLRRSTTNSNHRCRLAVLWPKEKATALSSMTGCSLTDRSRTGTKKAEGSSGIAVVGLPACRLRRRISIGRRTVPSPDSRKKEGSWAAIFEFWFL
ncbi:hypothetical protein MRB53_002427 [Persea americana]|uniref:Uncharacterized protein n=1 Tax=Persea americana TaxID=3435 RepID=A0ACC2MUK7_PERAE|nr:hypothetical protein MRB53_002427 [Persea americana]